MALRQQLSALSQRTIPARSLTLRCAIEDRICQFLGFDPAEIVPAARLYDDLDIDSYDLCELLDDLEVQLGVPIPEQPFGEAETVEDVVRVASDAFGARHGDGRPDSR